MRVCQSLAAAAVLLLAGPVVAQAQQTARVYRIGSVYQSTPSTAKVAFSDAFRQRLRELGLVEGKNLIVEERSAEGRPERLPELVAEVLRLKVDVLVVGSTAGALAAKRATTTVPIVFAGVLDPLGGGIVTSLARPGGNITGVTWGAGGPAFAGKWVQLLKEAVPRLSHFAVLSNSANLANAPFVPEIQAAARTLKMKIDVLDARNATDWLSAVIVGLHSIPVPVVSAAGAVEPSTGTLKRWRRSISSRSPPVLAL